MIIIPGKFPGLNEYISASKKKKGNWNAGNSMKHKDQARIREYIPRGLRYSSQIFITYTFYEPNTRRDKDNISGYFHKIFQDALIEAGVIPNDGWKTIWGFADYFGVDRKNPRIEIVIEEVR